MEDAKRTYPLIAEIASLIGDAATMMVIDRFTGRSIVFTKKELEGVIGREAADKLKFHFGTTQVYIPTCRKSMHIARNKAIAARFDELTKTLSARQAVTVISQEYRLTERYTWRLLKRSTSS